MDRNADQVIGDSFLTENHILSDRLFLVMIWAICPETAPRRFRSESSLVVPDVYDRLSEGRSGTADVAVRLAAAINCVRRALLRPGPESFTRRQISVQHKVRQEQAANGEDPQLLPLSQELDRLSLILALFLVVGQVARDLKLRDIDRFAAFGPRGLASHCARGRRARGAESGSCCRDTGE